MALRAPVAPHLSDPDAERARVEHETKIRELQGLPMAGARILSNVSLADGIATPIPHGLGKLPSFVKESCVRGASTVGMVVEVRDGSVDRAKTVLLKATGYGATVTVDVVVV